MFGMASEVHNQALVDLLAEIAKRKKATLPQIALV
jgi:hypothetical protein